LKLVIHADSRRTDTGQTVDKYKTSMSRTLYGSWTNARQKLEKHKTVGGRWLDRIHFSRLQKILRRSLRGGRLTDGTAASRSFERHGPIRCSKIPGKKLSLDFTPRSTDFKTEVFPTGRQSF
jgi:hypothetical protein